MFQQIESGGDGFAVGDLERVVDHGAFQVRGDAALAAEFSGGAFATIYLAPHNYHRVHMPLAGTLRLARFVPGDLFSVNAAEAQVVRYYANSIAHFL